ncbi:GTP-binding protein HflX [Seinonella peptonophila]|uniref:GTPase HflX n=1 Tax=Seinonella peptonophila TaxID=112248 RepID=A0A1M4T1K7_9BACL|nr:GTPase HflX [Seinonella peptonophila]SHE38372.1 GTP-binding protein HflX [Seinonella peptonophila]
MEVQLEKAILVGCGSNLERAQLLSSLEELSKLAETANAEVVGESIQYRDRLDASSVIGKGKVEELVRLAEEKEADLIIFDRELSPSQVQYLEQRFPCKVIDRTQLILDIFAKHAQTKEGRLQVELAQLEYMLPRLVGLGSSLSRLGAGIGTRGPGETKLETDRRHIRRRIKECKKQLEEVERHRQLLSRQRKKSETPQIALVGYTNAGKSTLLNRLTEADVLAEDRLFATLDPTTRYLELPSKRHVYLTDTVGFIRHLPHSIVAAFRSTLTQTKEADLLLHVVDASDPEVNEQILAVEQVLEELGASHIPILTVFNKSDLLEQELWEEKQPNSIHISAFSDEDLIRLRDRIDLTLPSGQINGKAVIPLSKGEFLAEFYRFAQVNQSKTNDDEHILWFTTELRKWSQMPQELKDYVVEKTED